MNNSSALERHQASIALCLALLAITAACSPVSQVRIRDDFAHTDRTRTYRVQVVTQPQADPRIAALYSTIAVRYINQHRDFIVRKTALKADKTGLKAPKSACQGKAQAVLALRPVAVPHGDDVSVRIDAELRRCSGWVRIWSATVRDTWPSSDGQLRALTTRYVSEFGSVAKTHAGPAFRALRLLLDTLPYPKLIKEADIDEKIEL